MEKFEDFYKFYLEQHTNRFNIGLHYIGTTISIILIIYCVAYANVLMIIPSIFLGYIFAWIGHFVFEKNTPAAFKYPVKSFLSDIRLWQSVNKRLIRILLFTSLNKKN